MKIEDLQELLKSMNKNRVPPDHPHLVIANALTHIAVSLHEINETLKQQNRGKSVSVSTIDDVLKFL